MIKTLGRVVVLALVKQTVRRAVTKAVAKQFAGEQSPVTGSGRGAWSKNTDADVAASARTGIQSARVQWVPVVRSADSRIQPPASGKRR